MICQWHVIRQLWTSEAAAILAAASERVPYGPQFKSPFGLFLFFVTIATMYLIL
jgi:hypothetical protein